MEQNLMRFSSQFCNTDDSMFCIFHFSQWQYLDWRQCYDSSFKSLFFDFWRHIKTLIFIDDCHWDEENFSMCILYWCFRFVSNIFDEKLICISICLSPKSTKNWNIMHILIMLNPNSGCWDPSYYSLSNQISSIYTSDL